MKLFSFALFLNVVGIIICLKFSCDKRHQDYRERNKEILEQNGVLFVAVSYTQIGRMSSDREGGHPIKNYLSKSQIPLLFHTISTQNSYCLSYVSSAKGQYIFCNFYPYPATQKQFYSRSHCTQSDELFKAYFFASPIIGESFVVPEKFMFKACRLFINSKKQMQVEKSLLILNRHLSEDEMLIDEDDLEQELTNSTFKVFNYEEFEDKDFCICDHMISYFNECPQPKEISDFNVIN